MAEQGIDDQVGTQPAVTEAAAKVGTTNSSEDVTHAVKFFLFSLSAGAIQAVGFTTCHEVLGLSYRPSYMIALTLSVVWNFTLNRKFTFKSAANVPVAMAKIAAFYAAFLPISTALGTAATNSGTNEYVVLGLTMVSNLALEFLFTKYYVYRNQINTA